MITISDVQRDNILHQTSSLIDYVNKLHTTFSQSPNISDKALAEWHQTIYQTVAVLENVDLQVKKLEESN